MPVCINSEAQNIHFHYAYLPQCIHFTLLHYMSLSTMLLWQLSLTCNKETYLSLHAKCPILNKLGFF